MTQGDTLMINTSKTVTLTLCVLGLGLLAAGCGDVDFKVRNANDGASSQATPNPDQDPRSPAEIRAENVQLRQTMMKLEQNHRDWEAALDLKDKEIDALKDQRDSLEKQRDRAKGND
jgi:hypothetical protein